MAESETWQPETMPVLLIATAARTLSRLADVRFRDLGLAIGQMPVLVALKDGAALSQKELARLAGVEQPSMAQLLSRMERDGLIRREADPDDGRSSLICLTETAFGRIGPARSALALGNEVALTGFDTAEIRQLTDMLHRIIANVGENTAPSGMKAKAKRRRSRRRGSVREPDLA